MNNYVKIFLAGDSTVQTYDESYVPQCGWGQVISRYFTEDVTFVNKSIGGRSSRSFFNEGRLDVILDEIGSGDYLFIQFGHNDATIQRPERYVDGVGFKMYLEKYIDGAMEKNATPVLITPMGRYSLDSDNKFITDFKIYVQAMKEVALDKSVALIDLCTKSLDLFNEVGLEGTKKFFMMLPPDVYPKFKEGLDDHTHFQEKGAIELAKLVAEGVKESNLPIAKSVKI